MTSTQPGFWDSIGGVASSSPTVALLGMLLAAFLAGFGVRKFFEDREVKQAKADAAGAQVQLHEALDQLRTIDDAEEAHSARADRISRSISPTVLNEALRKQLASWPEGDHPLIVAGVIRQLLLMPGYAFLCTPEQSVRIKADFETEDAKSVVTVESVAKEDDPIKDVRDLVSDPEQFSNALLPLAAYGYTTMTVPDGPRQIMLRVVQKREKWSVVKSTYEKA